MNSEPMSAELVTIKDLRLSERPIPNSTEMNA